MNASARALLAHAAHPDAPDSVLFARLIGARIESGDLLLLGLDAGRLSGLIGRHFPGAVIDRPPGAMLWSAHWPFVRDLRGLLMWHDRTAARQREDAVCLAIIISAASLRPDHLWRDLGLAGRDDVTDMLGRHYPDLIAVMSRTCAGRSFSRRKSRMRKAWRRPARRVVRGVRILGFAIRRTDNPGGPAMERPSDFLRVFSRAWRRP